MKGERKYYVIIFSIFLILFLIQQSQKEPTNYDHTYSHRDKNPYGGYVLKTLLPEFFGDNEVQSLNLTLYELEDQFKFDSNLILIADQINLSDEDTDVLLDGVSLGMTAFVSANVIGGKLADTLKFFTARNEIEYVASGNKDTSSVSLVHPSLAGNDFRFKRDAIAYYFDDLDSLDHKVLANNAERKPVAITVKWGAGKIVLCTTPLAFTNNYFFFEENSRFASALMSELPSQSTIWTEYYQLGRLQFGSPLSIIMKTSALRLAYTITLVSLALFMIFEAKRRQRIIPIIVPLKNTTVDFIKTIGNLYMRKGNHKDIALKRIQYLLEHIRSKYYLNFEKFNADFFEKLAAKSGQDVISIKKLFDQIERIKNKAQVSAQELQLLSQQIEVFYGRK
ncbi:MAG: hypothetical protein ACJAZV_002336 [Roseivirga sp.]|jgi:hypothetical protein